MSTNPMIANPMFTNPMFTSPLFKNPYFPKSYVHKLYVHKALWKQVTGQREFEVTRGHPVAARNAQDDPFRQVLPDKQET